MIIGVINQKGGVGKTTICTNISAQMARAGQRVILIDADPQCSALDWAAARREPLLFPVIGQPTATVHREIDLIGRGFQSVIIDGPPRLTDASRSVIMASDLVLIPVQPSPYDIWAAKEVVELVREAEILKESIKSAFLLNRKIENTVIGREAIEALADYNLPILETSIAQRVVFAEAVATGQAVHEIEPSGPAVAEIESLTSEIKEFCK